MRCYYYCYCDPQKKKLNARKIVVHAHSIYRSLSLFLLSPTDIYLYIHYIIRCAPPHKTTAGDGNAYWYTYIIYIYDNNTKRKKNIIYLYKHVIL